MRRLWTAFAAMALAAGLHSETKINGFIKAWATLGENNSRAVRQAGLLLKSARVKIAAEPGEGIKAVIVPELAGGLQLLDAYAVWEALPGLLSIEAGQFKIPFGQDRMETPASLERVDYSMIDKAILPRNAWDDGFMLTLKGAGLKADLAAFEGLGPNLALPAGSATGSREMQEFSGSLEYAVAEGIAVGASAYSGLNGAASTSQCGCVGGAHARAKVGPADLRAELIHQNAGRYGVSVVPGWRLDESLKLLAYYDHVEDPLGNALARTSVGGGLLFQLNAAIRLNLEMGGSSAGPSESPENFGAVFQALAKF